MKIVKIPKKNLDLFVSVLPAWGELHAPVKRQGGFAFDRPKAWSDVVLNYDRTILPPKKYLLPPNECTFSFNAKEGFRDRLDEATKPIVLFGVHTYDIYGMNILDRVFAEGAFPDPYYITRRKNTTVIGLDFEPDDKHFAGSMSADSVDRGFDLFLSDIGEDYLVLVGTSRGDDIVVKSGCLLSAPTEDDINEYKRRSQARRAAYKIRVNLADLPEILEMEYKSSLWDELGAKCVSCGACSMVCPTCYCFDVKDEVSLGANAGTRLRMWDSCLFQTHALVAGGENFRKRRASRVKFRYYHKQRGFVAEYGRPSCVGCGRCIASCPAKIDIVQVIENIRGEGNEHTDRAAASSPAR